MSEIEKMKRYIERTKMNAPTAYGMNMHEVFELSKQAYGCGELPIEIIDLAFNYGKAKGYRAAKAERRARA